MSTCTTDGAMCGECGLWMELDRNGGFCCEYCMQPLCSDCYRHHIAAEKEKHEFDGNPSERV